MQPFYLVVKSRSYAYSLAVHSPSKAGNNSPFPELHHRHQPSTRGKGRQQQDSCQTLSMFCPLASITISRIEHATSKYHPNATNPTLSLFFFGLRAASVCVSHRYAPGLPPPKHLTLGTYRLVITHRRAVQRDQKDVCASCTLCCHAYSRIFWKAICLYYVVAAPHGAVTVPRVLIF